MKYYIDENLISAKTDRGAIRQMNKIKGKYLMFYRSSDGQIGYINQDGNASITGYKWEW